MATQVQTKQVNKVPLSRAATVQRVKTKRQINKKTTPAYLQAKLNVSSPDDPHEREADQVADNVMRMPVQKSAEGVNRASLKSGIATTKNTDSDRASRDSLKSGEQLVNRASLKVGDAAIQRKEDGTGSDAPSNIENRINAKRGQGDKLPDAIRSDMETRFDNDFSAVRIHTDKDANEMCRDIDAKAFAVGNDIFFGGGQFDGNSDKGRRLLAHELTHVIQQHGRSKVGGSEDTQEISKSETKVQRWFLGSWLADKAWDILEKVAPKKLFTLVKEISQKGILRYLKDKIMDAVSFVFNGLKQGANVLGRFFASFGNMAKTAKGIIKSLVSGCCKGLFAAVKQLKETLGAVAGDAWKAITEFFAPIGSFFTELWSSWGAPVLDWLKKTAGDTWAWLKDLGKSVWEWTKPVRDYAGSAWSWLKGKLGLGGSGSQGDSEGGLMGWVKDQAQSVWNEVKQVMDPVIKPVKKFAGKVMEILPIKAILNLRETVQGWLNNATKMGEAMGDDGSGVAKQQISLRETILPAVIKTMQSVRTSLASTGLWIGEKIGGIVSGFSGFMSNLRENPLLNSAAYLLEWIEVGLTSLGEWAKDTVQSLFNMLGDGLVKLAKFIEPILNTLQKIVDVLLNLLGKLPGLILGPLWRAIPKCIRNPLKDFVLNQILARIPFFKQLLAVKDAWEQIKATGLLILKQVFVDGNLIGALWTLFKAMLKIFKLPVKLISNIIVKGAQSLGAIIAAPIDFLINILRAMKLGFSNFFGNILTHLLKGAMDWLFSAVSKAGLTIPTDFSLKSIFIFVMDILGLTMELVWKKLADKIGQAKVDKFKKVIAYASGALEWLKLAFTKGPSAIWDKIKEKLSDLWNVVLNGVIGWISTKVIAWATRWLVSLLDVTGITPIINATIAIYKAIQSFMEHVKAMLRIVNSVLNGIADLAMGAIESAAKFLEGALVSTIPIVISFLANQAGLGNIAQKITEILEKVRLKVDQAITWLIDTVVDAIKAFIGKVKDGVQSIIKKAKAWWKTRKSFSTKDGSKHSLYYKGSGASSEMMVASEPKTIRELVSSKKWEGVEIEESDVQKIKDLLRESLELQKRDEDPELIKIAITEVLSKYNIGFGSDFHKPTGEDKGNPILIYWYKDVKDYAVIKYSDLDGNTVTKGIREGLTLAGGDVIKVDTDNIKKEGDSWQKKKNSENRIGSLVERLKNHNKKIAEGKSSSTGMVKLFDSEEPEKELPIGNGDMSTTYHIDHVRDLEMGGVDSFSNLWPMMASKNLQANKNSSQKVMYKGEKVAAKDLPIGTYIKVVEQLGVSGGGQETPIQEPGKMTDGTKGSPVLIKWYKKESDYPTIKVETKKNKKSTVSEYAIGQKVKTGNVTLQVNNRYRNVEGNSWKITKKDKDEKGAKRQKSSEVSRQIRRVFKSDDGNGFSIVDSGEGNNNVELKPIPTTEQTHGDHVMDRDFGGSDNITFPGNLWVMRADKNLAAGKNSSQYVAVKGENTAVQANTIDQKWVKIVGQTEALSGDLATSKHNPAGKMELTKLKKAKAS